MKFLLLLYCSLALNFTYSLEIILKWTEEEDILIKYFFMIFVWWKKLTQNFRQCLIKLVFCFSFDGAHSYFYKVARYKLKPLTMVSCNQDSVALEGFLCEFSFDLPSLKLWIHHWCDADLSGFVLTYKAWIKSKYIQKYINWNSVHGIIYFPPLKEKYSSLDL